VNPTDPFGLIGQVLDGQFRVDKFVGEGGFSHVYRGLHAGLDEPIAIKCLKLPPALGSALVESFVRRFRDESRIHYRLSQGSLAIARSIASGTTMSSSTSALVPYMVLEWLDGRSLAQDFEVRRAHGQRGRSLDEMVKLLDSAAQGLAFAHSQGVVHRDMNPGNLFLAETRQQGAVTKVLDFGVAKVVSDHALELGPRAQTLGHIRIFAPAYGSPEQFDDTVGKVGSTSDVYSFALIALEALRDLPVREGEHLGEFALQALDANARPTPRALGIPVGDAVEEVFARAVALRPADRPSDLGEFWGSFKHALRVDAQSGKDPHADGVARAPNAWKPHPPAAGQAAPDRPVTADMRAPIVEVARPGSVAHIALDPGGSHLQRGTVRMQQSSNPPPPAGSGAPALAKSPLTSTLMMENRVLPTPVPPQVAQPLTSTLAMPSPYARSQSVLQQPVGGDAEVNPSASTLAIDPSAAFAVARANAEAAARAVGVGPPPSEVPTIVPPPPRGMSGTKGKRVAVLVAVALVLVGLAAFAGYRSRVGGPDGDAHPASPAQAAASVHAAATPSAAALPASAAALTASPAAQAASPATAPTVATPSTTPPSPRSEPTPPRPAGADRAARSGDAPWGGAATTPRAAPTPIAAAQVPSPSPAPGGARAFDPVAARAALGVIDGVLASCRSQGGRVGEGTFTVTFAPDGHAQHAAIDEPPFAGTPEGACVSSRFRQAKVAPFEGAPGSVVYTFHIPQ
jgi:serine/threonine protein kinase